MTWGFRGNVTESCHPRIMVDDVGLDLAPYDVTEDTGSLQSTAMPT